MDYDEYFDYEEASSPPRMRLQRFDPLLHFTDDEFRDRFRMRQHCVIEFSSVISSALEAHRIGDHILSPMMQLMVALRFYADGSFLRSIGDLFNISKASVSRIVHRISKAICRIRQNYIKFPTDNEIPDIKRAFYDIASFPGKYWLPIR